MKKKALPQTTLEEVLALRTHLRAILADAVTAKMITERACEVISRRFGLNDQTLQPPYEDQASIAREWGISGSRVSEIQWVNVARLKMKVPQFREKMNAYLQIFPYPRQHPFPAPLNEYGLL